MRAAPLLCMLTFGLAAPAARAEETCVQCHRTLRDPRLRQPTDDLPSSVHGEKGVTCSGCHRGRPDEPSARAHDPNAGFRPRAAADDPQLVCGGCHADKARMGGDQPGRRSDQLALYQSSVHGRAFAKGNAQAATCASCHGAHSVRRVRDPLASVNPRNVAATCGKCHSDPGRMTPLRMPHDEEAQWRRSVHGLRHAAWLASATQPGAGSERHPPTCTDCHQDHGIGPRDEALAGCQGCHAPQWQSFQAGPHAKAFARMGFLPCVDCHGSHGIAPVSASLVGVDHEAACRRCHAEGQRMFGDIGKLALQVRSAEAEADRARRRQSGAPVALLAARLRPVDEAQHALRLVFHTLDLAKIASTAHELELRARAVPSSGSAENALVERARSNLPALLLLLVGAGALVLALRRSRGGAP